MSDAAAIFDAYAADPVATRYLSWPPRQRVEEVSEWLAPNVAGWEGGSQYRWVITDHPQGDALGTVSLRRSETGFDLGYALATHRAGNGITTDVVSRVLAVGTNLLPGARVTAKTDPDNIASVRVLDKAGFVFDRCDPASSVRPGLGSGLRDTLIFTADVGGDARESWQTAITGAVRVVQPVSADDVLVPGLRKRRRPRRARDGRTGPGAL